MHRGKMEQQFNMAVVSIIKPTVNVPKPPSAPKLSVKPTKINTATGKGCPGGFKGTNTTKPSIKTPKIPSAPQTPKIPSVGNG